MTSRLHRALAAGALAIACAAGLAACPPQNTPKPVPPPTGVVPAYEPPGTTAEPPPTVVATPAGAGSGGAGGRPTGARCTAAADCASGICEGPGCGDNKGVCAAKQRTCTFDLQAYCGCDGNTFRASGTCPGRRFSQRGACKAPGSP